MDKETFISWLTAYGKAWENRDPEAAAELFSQDAIYYETPFEQPMKGREAIIAYWSQVPRTQDQIRFSYEILAIQGDFGIAHWTAGFIRLPSQSLVKIDGILTTELDRDGRCRIFREWWHKTEENQNFQV
jgi:uncharacterized protein (TIGR02246 family)